MAGEERRLSFLLDVDDTLLDNDALKEYLADELRATLGTANAERFWTVYEDVRHERDVVDLPLTARRYAEAAGDPQIAAAIDHLYQTIPFQSFVYPHAFETLRHLARLGTTGILSDGDSVFQRLKIERSGLGAAVDGRVLIYIHKEGHLDAVAKAWPADHTVIVDDKARILAAVAGLLGERVTTVHVLQGHYAHEPLPPGFQADITVPAIGDLRALEADRFWPRH